MTSIRITTKVKIFESNPKKKPLNFNFASKKNLTFLKSYLDQILTYFITPIITPSFIVMMKMCNNKPSLHPSLPTKS